MLPQNKEIFDYLNITAWHNAGYRGQGLTVGVMDAGYNQQASPFKDVIVATGGNAGTGETHALASISIIKQILPEAKIVYGYNVIALGAILKHKPDLCSMSLSTASSPTAQQAAMASNIPLVKSAGNQSIKGVSRPGFDEQWISVAALSFDNGNPSVMSYSSMGGEVEVAMLTNLRVHSYTGDRIYGGTSCAAPTFAGMLGLFISGMRRKLPINALRPTIYKYCKDIHVPGRDIHTGHGIFILPAPGSVR